MISLSKIQNIEPVVYYDQIYDPNFSMPIHQHNTLELMYLEKGAMSINYIDIDKNANTATLNAGQFVLIMPYIEHKITIPENIVSRIQNIEFFYADADIVKYLCNDCIVSSSSNTLKSIKDIAIFDDTLNLHTTLLKLHSIVKSYDKESEDFLMSYPLLTAQLFLDIIKSSPAEKAEKKGNRHINNAIKYINLNYHNSNLNIDDIAKATTLSTAYLQQLFIQELECTILAKINETRIQKAVYLLKHTSLSSLEISKRIGYNNVQSFINNFKKFYTIPPRQYRQTQNISYTNFASGIFYQLQSEDEKAK